MSLWAAVSGLVLAGWLINGSAQTATSAGTSVTKLRAAPEFRDYPVTRTFNGTNAAVRLASPAERKFRTMLTQGASNKPNFAGDYILVMWGCGSGCADGAVIDPGSGKVHWLPSMVVGCNSTCIGYEDKKFVDFRPDSKLLVLNGMRETVKGRGIAKVAGADVLGSFYYLFENGHFRLLHSVAAEIERFDDTE